MSRLAIEEQPKQGSLVSRRHRPIAYPAEATDNV